MIYLLIAILCVLVYICSILRTIAANQVQTAIHNRTQRREMLDGIVREIKKMGNLTA